MGAVPQAIASAVPSAVTTAGSVPVNGRPQRGPYQPMTGSSVVPYVPSTDEPDADEMAWQPSYGTAGKTGATLADGSTGAPSVPAQTSALWTPGPIDPHYTVPSGRNPYAKTVAPTRGMLTFIKSFANHVWNGRQNVDNAGWQQGSPQQRTSYMRILPPPQGGGFAPATSTPQQMPQQPRTARFGPTTGTDAPGVRVLNSSTYGAGQTAGGIGGSQYTPAASPPDSTPVASVPAGSGMPTWG